MTSSGNWTPNLLIFSPTRYPLGHIFPQINEKLTEMLPIEERMYTSNDVVGRATCLDRVSLERNLPIWHYRWAKYNLLDPMCLPPFHTQTRSSVIPLTTPLTTSNPAFWIIGCTQSSVFKVWKRSKVTNAGDQMTILYPAWIQMPFPAFGLTSDTVFRPVARLFFWGGDVKLVKFWDLLWLRVDYLAIALDLAILAGPDDPPDPRPWLRAWYFPGLRSVSSYVDFKTIIHVLSQHKRKGSRVCL